MKSETLLDLVVNKLKICKGMELDRVESETNCKNKSISDERGGGARTLYPCDLLVLSPVQRLYNLYRSFGRMSGMGCIFETSFPNVMTRMTYQANFTSKI